MKKIKFYAFILLLFIFIASCQKEQQSVQQVQIKGRVVYPYSGEVYGGQELLILLKNNKGQEQVAATFTNDKGEFSFNEKIPNGSCFLVAKGLNGSLHDLNSNMICGALPKTESVQHVDFYVDKGDGKIKFNVNRQNELDNIENIRLEFGYEGQLESLTFTKISMFGLHILESMYLDAPVGECLVYISFLKNGVYNKIEKNVTIIKNETSVLELLI